LEHSHSGAVGEHKLMTSVQWCGAAVCLCRDDETDWNHI